MPVRYDLSGATVTDVRRSVAAQWIAQRPNRPDMAVQDAAPDMAGEPRGEWLFRGCDFGRQLPTTTWGVVFVACRFRPFHLGHPVYGPMTMLGCDVELESGDEGLSIFGRDTRFTVPERWRPTVEKGSWLHRCDVAPDLGPFTRKGGHIRSDDHSLALVGDRLARRLDLPAAASGWAVSARFSLEFGTTAGGLVEAEPDEYGAVREAFREHVMRTGAPYVAWSDRPGGGFTAVFLNHLAVFDRGPDGRLEFWSGRIPASFATDAFGADVLLPNVPARLTAVP